MNLSLNELVPVFITEHCFLGNKWKGIEKLSKGLDVVPAALLNFFAFAPVQVSTCVDIGVLCVNHRSKVVISTSV